MATDNDRLNDALAELEAVGIGTVSNDCGESWASTTITVADPNDPNVLVVGGTSAGDIQLDGSGNVVLGNGDGWYDSVSTGFGQATVQIGALTLMAGENGDVEIVIDADGLREEYHINADKVRNFLRSIADVVVEGRET